MIGLEAYFKGLLWGTIFIASFGPIFFTIIETSINKGFWAAASIAIGTLLSDTLYISIAFLGVSAFLENPRFKFWLGICGGILLIIFGVLYFFKKPKIEKIELSNNKGIGYMGYGLKGFLINSLNPFVFITWLSIMGVASVDYETSKTDRLIFFSGIITCIFLSDLLKAYIADQIKHLLTKQLMIWVNRIAGSVMLYFGVELIWKVLHGKGI